jgi:hypothetical protein
LEPLRKKTKNENIFYEKDMEPKVLILREGIIECERNKELGFPSSVPLHGIGNENRTTCFTHTWLHAQFGGAGVH